jgi:hypothetical protein
MSTSFASVNWRLTLSTNIVVLKNLKNLNKSVNIIQFLSEQAKVRRIISVSFYLLSVEIIALLSREDSVPLFNALLPHNTSVAGSATEKQHDTTGLRKLSVVVSEPV